MSPVSSRDGHLHVAMAGRGNPYAVLTAERLPVLRALNDDGTSMSVAAALGMSEQVLAAELSPLVAAGLVEQRGDWYAPRFVIVDAAEVRRVDRHALDLGQALAARLRAGWDAIASAGARLAGVPDRGLVELGFLLVGDRILDVGLLDALAADGRLLPPAPPRPVPGDPDARYYLWMIEGERADLGQYGQRATSLLWPDWLLLTFGRYAAPGAPLPGPARDALEAVALAHAAAHLSDGPGGLAAALGLPLFNGADTRAWDRFAADVAGELLGVYLAEEPSLRALWSSLRAAAIRPDAFAEFFCWYDHLVYAHAIDDLVAAGAFEFPTSGYTAALWHAPQDSGAF